MRRGALVAILLVLLLGCGRKGPPLPPLVEVPETTVSLQLHQEEREVVLTWPYPTMTRGGRPLADLDRVEVWRLEVAPGQEQIAATPQGEELRRALLLGRGKRIDSLADALLDEATRGPNLEFRDALPPKAEAATPITLWYAVRTVRRDGTASALSNIVSHQEQDVPAAVEGFAAKPRADGIALSWKAVPDVKYVVERRAVPSGSWRDTDPYITNKTELVDTSVRQGTTWRYRVRALAALTTGPVSPEIEVPYPDVYAPKPPATLYCLPEATLVRVRWDPSPEEGVRYKVFRRQGEEKWTQLEYGTTLTEHVDTSPPAGAIEYGVKAVDFSGNQSDATYCQVQLGP